MDRIRDVQARYGFVETLLAMSQIMGQSHAMKPRKGKAVGPYPWLAANGFDSLRPWVWQDGEALEKIPYSLESSAFQGDTTGGSS